jgi:microcystin degradation protein MlrC
MSAVGLQDAEGDLIKRVVRWLVPDVWSRLQWILHGNVTETLAEHLITQLPNGTPWGCLWIKLEQ